MKKSMRQVLFAACVAKVAKAKEVEDRKKQFGIGVPQRVPKHFRLKPRNAK